MVGHWSVCLLSCNLLLPNDHCTSDGNTWTRPIELTSLIDIHKHLPYVAGARQLLLAPGLLPARRERRGPARVTARRRRGGDGHLDGEEVEHPAVGGVEDGQDWHLAKRNHLILPVYNYVV